MFVTRLKLKNWRNFRDADMPLQDITYVLGANATGKSNLLDVFRFLRDVSKTTGGGLQQAIAERGGISKVRCLHARRDTEVRIEIEVAEAPGAAEPTWRYVLGFRAEGKGAQRILVSEESVWRADGQGILLSRPGDGDRQDDERLTQTHLEQIQANADFRDLAAFFGSITYLHLVPQMLRYDERLGSRRLEDDPFGQGLLDRIARTPDKTREARLRRIQDALSQAIPQFRQLRFQRDEANGQPHLEALYAHHRPNAGWQKEDQFSDGTLRLIGLLWSLLDGDSLLLIEEPELSLNDGIVEQIPRMLQRTLRQAKRRRQVILSTHSEALLRQPGIDGRSVLVLELGPEGSTVRQVDEQETLAIESGFSVAEAVLPRLRTPKVAQLGMWP